MGTKLELKKSLYLATKIFLKQYLGNVTFTVIEGIAKYRPHLFFTDKMFGDLCRTDNVLVSSLNKVNSLAQSKKPRGSHPYNYFPTKITDSTELVEHF